MPSSLLDSQFATLEEPAPDEHPIIVSIEPAPQVITERIVSELAISTPAGVTVGGSPKTAPSV